MRGTASRRENKLSLCTVLFGKPSPFKAVNVQFHILPFMLNFETQNLDAFFGGMNIKFEVPFCN